ncbi:MAG TPA: class I SAM-dependent methyltransferase, partial [Anaerolineales bacterium]|nr:class I SAM-dependent methyltransferase [Anaerolineales bacterium]
MPSDPIVAALTKLAQRPSSPSDFLALAEAHSVLGENDVAASYYRRALKLKPDFTSAYAGLARLRMPGSSYYKLLDRLYAALAPESILEIGVADGASLSLARAPTVAIGVDPEPSIKHTLGTETHIFTETSDAFFASRSLKELLKYKPLGVGFIDGLHIFEQALRDFINLESCCDRFSVILLHDTVPLDELTQRRVRETAFYTGDVWKTVVCLKEYRPDLDIFTVSAPPTGLTIVSGLDPSSRVLTENYESAVAKFVDMPFSAIEHRLEAALNVVPNDWRMVKRRLTQKG